MDEYIDHWYIHKTIHDYVEHFPQWWKPLVAARPQHAVIVMDARTLEDHTFAVQQQSMDAPLQRAHTKGPCGQRRRSISRQTGCGCAP